MIPKATLIVPKELHLPLEPFLALLRRRGFTIKPDDYLEVLRLVRQFGTRSIDETAEWLCPVLATSPFEQSLFYTVLEEYKSRQAPVAAANTGKRSWLRRYWWVHAVILAIVIVSIIALNPSPPLRAKISVLNNHYLVGDTIFLEASEVFQNRLSDTSETIVFWRLNNELPVKGYHTQIVVKEEGPIRIIQSLRSGNIDTTQRMDTAYSYACSFVPDFDLVVDKADIHVHDKVTISVVPNNTTQKNLVYKWDQTGVTDSSFSGDTLMVLSFDTTGSYQISCTAIPADGYAGCSVTKEISLNVTQVDDKYALDMRMAGGAWETPKPRMKKILHWLLLIPTIGGILLLDFLKRKKTKKPGPRRDNEPDAKTKTETEAEPVPELKPVFEVPFEKRDTKLVADETSLKKVFNQMRQKTESDFLQLDIGGTVKTITRSGGMPNLIFAPRMAAKEFLVLIDRTNPKSMVTAFYDWFARAMADANIPVTVIYFDHDFRCYHKDFPLGISLYRCGQLYGQHLLLIGGNGYNLLDRAYPVFNPAHADALNQWEEKAILTPVPYPDWGIREKTIAEKIILLPADLHTLEYLMPALREKSLHTAKFLQLKKALNASLLDWDFEDVEELISYLGNDEVLFQWLCSICLYPKIRWEVIVEAGNQICSLYKSPDLLNYSNLLTICRISWIAGGTYPQRTRLRLLKELKPENELAVRQTIIGMLKTAKTIYGEGYYFSFEQETQQVTNEFVLHANDPKKFAGYGESSNRFLSDWEKDLVTDAPMRRYLGPQEKDTWSTPLNHAKENEHAGLKLEALKRSEHIRKKGWMEYAESILGWGIIFYLLLLFKVLPANSKVFGIFYNKQPDKEVSFVVALNIRDTCLPGQHPYVTITTHDSDYHMQYLDFAGKVGTDSVALRPTGSALLYGTITGHYNAFSKPGARLLVGWDNGEERSFDLLALSDSILLTAACLQNRETPPVQTNDTTALTADSLETIELPTYIKSNLRTSFNEIWTSSTGKMAIDLNQNIIYTQLNGGKGLQQNLIKAIYKSSGTGDYSIIVTDPGGGSFQKIIINSGNAEQFQLAGCGTKFKEEAKALEDPSNCDKKYTYSLYYAGDRAKVFIPRNGTNYVNTEIMKIRQSRVSLAEKIEQISPPQTQQVQQQVQRGTYSLMLNVFINTYYYANKSLQNARQEQIKKGWKFSGKEAKTGWSFTSFTGGPFDRDYINITLQYLVNETAPETPEEKPIGVSLSPNQLSRIIEFAGKEVGVTEEPIGSNKGQRVNEYLASIGLQPGLPWSTAFVYWVYKQANAEAKLRKTGSLMELWNSLNPNERITQKEAMANPSLIQPGNLFFIQFGKNIGQIGIVESVKGESIFTIEGNSNDKGTEDGTGVIRGVRQLNNITLGFSNFGQKALGAKDY